MFFSKVNPDVVRSYSQARVLVNAALAKETITSLEGLVAFLERREDLWACDPTFGGLEKLMLKAVGGSKGSTLLLNLFLAKFPSETNVVTLKECADGLKAITDSKVWALLPSANHIQPEICVSIISKMSRGYPPKGGNIFMASTFLLAIRERMKYFVRAKKAVEVDGTDVEQTVFGDDALEVKIAEAKTHIQANGTAYNAEEVELMQVYVPLSAKATELQVLIDEVALGGAAPAAAAPGAVVGCAGRPASGSGAPPPAVLIISPKKQERRSRKKSSAKAVATPPPMKKGKFSA